VLGNHRDRRTRAARVGGDDCLNRRRFGRRVAPSISSRSGSITAGSSTNEFPARDIHTDEPLTLRRPGPCHQADESLGREVRIRSGIDRPGIARAAAFFPPSAFSHFTIDNAPLATPPLPGQMAGHWHRAGAPARNGSDNDLAPAPSAPPPAAASHRGQTFQRFEAPVVGMSISSGRRDVQRAGCRGNHSRTPQFLWISRRRCC